ncbi:MAG: heavy metal translocating P-type ATPase [Eubacterium sp.]
MTKYNITGMTCAACSARIEKTVNSVDGVTSCAVSLLTNSMSVEGNADSNKIIKAVEKAGYGASLVNDKREKSNSEIEDKETPKLFKRLVLSVVFLIPLMYISMGHMMWGWKLPSFMESNHIAMGLSQLLLCVVIMVINQKFFISGFKGIINRSPNMDTLVSLGSGASFIYSTYALFAMTTAQINNDMDAVMHYMDSFYFESAATILTLITVGKALESYSKGKTTNALNSLMNLSPKTARIIVDGKEKAVPVSEIKIGDTVLVKPGESIAVDGEITQGNSTVDESVLTGESIPVDKEQGDSVSAGTMNLSGYIQFKATRIGENTTLSQIIKMVSDAASTKAPISKIADKVSGIFVPVVILIAIITFTVWLLLGSEFGYALSRAISVLVISCPCALGLATPVAIMVGNGKGAKNGILFKTAASLEEAGRIQIVALDKTGTITVGNPVVTDVIPINEYTENELLSIAYSVEKMSEHPLAKAIINKALEKNISSFNTDSFKALVGSGVEAYINNEKVLAGSYKFISTIIDLDKETAQTVERLSDKGKTPMLFVKDEKLIGIIAVADVIKQDSPQAVKELQNMGIKVVMLTGDNSRTAKAIGDLAGVDYIMSDMLPGDKETAIKELQSFGKVAMVGDGINDAPALTRANIGIAINAGADIAIDAADVVLMNSKLSDVPSAIRLSRATLTNIHENLFWAFIYNVIGIPLAAGVMIGITGWTLNPMFAAAAMSLSSVSVVLNALRLNLFNLHSAKHDRRIKPINIELKEKEKMKKVFNVDGMMCSHCEAHIVNAISVINGVESVKASHESKTVEVELSKDVDDSIIKSAIEKEGYTVL